MKTGRRFFLAAVLLTAAFSSFADSPARVPGPGREGLVLSGGGAKGAYQIGVWKALMDTETDFHGVFGVSVGAINAAAMMTGNYELVKDFWLNVGKDDIMALEERELRLMEGEYDSETLVALAGKIAGNRGLDVTPLERLLCGIIPEEKVRCSGMDFGLITFSLSEMKPEFRRLEEIPEGSLLDWILASANFPFFERKRIGNETYIDGGVWTNIPISMADNGNYSEVFVLSLGYKSPLDYFDYLSDFRKYSVKVVNIEPAESVCGPLDFSPENAERLMQMGYADGLRAVGCAAGRKYCMISGEDVLEKMYLELAPHDAGRACSLLGIKRTAEGSPTPAEYDELIMPAVMKLVPGVNPEEFSLGVIDYFAERLFVEEEDLVLQQDLLDAVLRAYTEGRHRNRVLDFAAFLRENCGLSVISAEKEQVMFIKSYESFSRGLHAEVDDAGK